MDLHVATASADPLAGVFWSAYKEAAGPGFRTAHVMESQSNGRAFNPRKPIEAALLFGPTGMRTILQQKRRHGNEPLPGQPRIHPMQARDADALAAVLEKEPCDLLVCVHFPLIIPARILKMSRLGGVNVHNGKLPHYKGHFGTFWEYANAEEQGDVTIHRMAKRVDRGERLAVASIDLQAKPLAEALIEKKRAGGRLLADFLNEVERTGKLPNEVETEAWDGRAYPWPSLKEMVKVRRKLRGS